MPKMAFFGKKWHFWHFWGSRAGSRAGPARDPGRGPVGIRPGPAGAGRTGRAGPGPGPGRVPARPGPAGPARAARAARDPQNPGLPPYQRLFNRENGPHHWSSEGVTTIFRSKNVKIRVFWGSRPGGPKTAILALLGVLGRPGRPGTPKMAVLAVQVPK